MKSQATLKTVTQVGRCKTTSSVSLLRQSRPIPHFKENKIIRKYILNILNSKCFQIQFIKSIRICTLKKKKKCILIFYPRRE